jgi:hypothetical protein
VLPFGRVVGRELLVASNQLPEQFVPFGERLEDDALRRALDLDACLGNVRERRGLDLEHRTGPLDRLRPICAEALWVEALEIREAPVLVFRRGERQRLIALEEFGTAHGAYLRWRISELPSGSEKPAI